MARAGLEPIGAPSKSRDLLVLLSSTAVGLPLMRSLGVASKVLGFLAIGSRLCLRGGGRGGGRPSSMRDDFASRLWRCLRHTGKLSP